MDDGIDVYALLGVSAEAGEKELTRAYRAKALQHHPDKNRDSPDAVRLFHSVKAAYDLLSDPKRRAAYDERRRAQLAKRQRQGALSGERKRMKSQLERDEQAARSAREAALAREQGMHAEAERFRDEALRDEWRRDRKMRDHVRQAHRAAEDDEAETAGAPSAFDGVDELDRSVRVRWAAAADHHHDRGSLAAMFGAFGELEEVVVAPVSEHARRGGSGESKPQSALLVFRSIAAAHALMSARPDSLRVRGFERFWAAGAEPAAVRNIIGAAATPAAESAPGGRAQRIPRMADIDLRQIRGSDMAFSDFESLTLMRMRQAGAGRQRPVPNTPL
ncbi:hypothetical protein LPJ61_003092 [Coemansia biformis]|uniref:J domain-containing protein n=1 Tax=Coemansia biformis TaxID=1286918 RepID=A0A9W8CYJ5_9FUNG|nr:hypothetical protein LPJ61_003092 [Coemansia biformis]